MYKSGSMKALVWAVWATLAFLGLFILACSSEKKTPPSSTSTNSDNQPQTKQTNAGQTPSQMLGRNWPDEFIAEEGVGIKGILRICDDASKIVPALGMPTEVNEIDNVWDGKIDDYDYSTEAGWSGTDLITVRVKKKTNRIIAIGLYSGVNWRTAKGISKGGTLLDLTRVYKKEPSEDVGFLSTGYEYEGLGITFYPGDYVTVTDDQGLPRKTQEVKSIEIRKAAGKRCPPSDSVAYDDETPLSWLRCPLGQTYTKETCKGKASKYKAGKAGNSCPVGYRIPTVEEITNLLSSTDAGIEIGKCASNFKCQRLLGNDMGEYLAIQEGDDAYWKISLKTGSYIQIEEEDSVNARCIRYEY